MKRNKVYWEQYGHNQQSKTKEQIQNWSNGSLCVETGKWRDRLLNYYFVSDRILIIHLKNDKEKFTIIAVYDTEDGKQEETEILQEE